MERTGLWTPLAQPEFLTSLSKDDVASHMVEPEAERGRPGACYLCRGRLACLYIGRIWLPVAVSERTVSVSEWFVETFDR